MSATIHHLPVKTETATEPTPDETAWAAQVLADFPAVPPEFLAERAAWIGLPGVARAALSLSGVTDASVAAILEASRR